MATADLYKSILGRDASKAELDYWSSTGLTGDALKSTFTNAAQSELSSKSTPARTYTSTPSYSSTATTTPSGTSAGGGSSASQLYKDILGRDASQSELDYWAGTGLTGDALKSSFTGAAQSELSGKSGGASASSINDLYKSILGRDADQAGLDYWMGTGKTGDDLVNSILAGARNDDRGSVLNRMYQDLFGRDAELAGIDYWSRDDQWSRLATGEGLDRFRLNLGASSYGDDEFLLMNRLAAADPSIAWASPFFDSANSNWVFNYLLDEDGFNRNTLMPQAQPMPQVLPPQGGGGGGSSNGYKDYHNAYLEDVLKGVIRDINERGEIARNDLGTAAFSSGAYGDSRHGVESAQLTEDLIKQIGDASNMARAQGFESAMGWYNRDLDRQTQIALNNAALQQNWTNSQYQGINMGQGIRTAEDQMIYDWLGSLRGLDDYDRSWQQLANNAAFEDFWAREQWDLTQLNAFLNAINAIPGQVGTQGTSQTPNNMWANIAGAATNSLLKNGTAGSGTGAFSIKGNSW
jgi:hypothetical protein